MFTDDIENVPASVARAIEEAILLGNTEEIGGVLAQVKDDEDFPDSLRYGLESLLYFRLYYGQGGALEPQKIEDKSRILQLEAYWGRELIDSLGYYPDLTDVKFA